MKTLFRVLLGAGIPLLLGGLLAYLVPELRPQLWLIAISILIALPMIVLLIAMWWVTLRLLDKAGGQSFRSSIWSKLHEDPRALAHYLGRRAIAIAILIVGGAFVFLRL